jgi:hypothetical protein
MFPYGYKGPQNAFRKIVGGSMKKELLKLAKTVIAPVALAVAMAFSPVRRMRRVMKAHTDLAADAVATAEGVPLLHRETTAVPADITADTVAGITPDVVITAAVDTMAAVGIMAWASDSELMHLMAMQLQHATLQGFMTRMAAGRRIQVAPFLTDINALAACGPSPCRAALISSPVQVLNHEILR